MCYALNGMDEYREPVFTWTMFQAREQDLAMYTGMIDGSVRQAVSLFEFGG